MQEDILLLIAFPYLGVMIGRLLTRKQQLSLLLIALFLLLPKLIKYNYVISWIDEILLTLVLANVYSLLTILVERTRKGIIFPTIFTLLLTVGLGFWYIIDAFVGTQTLERKWKVKDYQIEYIRDQGFTGKALMKYKLDKYAFFHLLKKNLDHTVEREEEQNNCHIIFKNVSLIFDKCENKIVTNVP